MTVGWQYSAYPFQHWIHDGFFPWYQIHDACLEFFPPSDPRWKTYRAPHEYGKQECSDATHWLRTVTELMNGFHHPVGVDMIEGLTGIRPLIPDALGGGMHQSPPDAKLDLHIDFNRHPYITDIDRRLNVILYLNSRPMSALGGDLRLFDAERDVTLVIEPRANRLVVFETGEATYHGHPEPVQGWVRKSLAMYYYAPAGEIRPALHSTIYLED